MKILGINDDHDTCECCGRKNLKRVVWLDNDGDVMAFGTECAAKAMGIDAKQVKEQQKAAITKAKQDRAGFLRPFQEAHDNMIKLAPSLAAAGFTARMTWIRQQPESAALQKAMASV